MGGRNNKLCDQRGQDPKGGLAGKETHQKKSCRRSKGPGQKDQNYTTEKGIYNKSKTMLKHAKTQ